MSEDFELVIQLADELHALLDETHCLDERDDDTTCHRIARALAAKGWRR